MIKTKHICDRCYRKQTTDLYRLRVENANFEYDICFQCLMEIENDIKETLLGVLKREFEKLQKSEK